MSEPERPALTSQGELPSSTPSHSSPPTYRPSRAAAADDDTPSPTAPSGQEPFAPTANIPPARACPPSDAGHSPSVSSSSSSSAIPQSGLAISFDGFNPLLDPAAHNPHPALPILTKTPHSRSPSAAGLHLQTDFTNTSSPSSNPPPGSPSTGTPTIVEHRSDGLRYASVPYSYDASGLSGSLRRGLSTASMASSLSPGSALSSPALNALADITPLPSPMMMGDSPGPWRRGSTSSRPPSQGSLTASGGEAVGWVPTGTISRQSSKKKSYGHLSPVAQEAYNVQAAHHHHQQQQQQHHHHHKPEVKHGRNRSISEYIPDGLHNARPRNITISSPHEGAESSMTADSRLRREEYLAEQRGLTQQSLPKAATAPATIPTPPPSNRSTTESEDELRDDEVLPEVDYLSVRVGDNEHKKKKLYRPIRQLGQGTFSKVMLCTSERIASKTIPDENSLDKSKLVAIKIVEHGPAGGADEERIELSLKREVEMLRSVSHPSLVNLMESDTNDRQTLLVLNYCAGGDLFDLASAHREVLSAEMVQRIFAELVGAVRYLHSQLIVHRDIKLENVLLNVSHDALPSSPITHASPLITLTDLGLSRRIPAPPASPLLTTRCGSEDYAAPEILLGQPYDGRATDAWALGVLLYSLIEGRLPFDPPPGGVRGAARSRGRTAHRVARCEWGWWRFGDDDGEWCPEKVGQEKQPELWEGARAAVESLLKKVTRGRFNLDQIAEMPWVKGGIQVEGGLRRLEETEASKAPDVEAGATEGDSR